MGVTSGRAPRSAPVDLQALGRTVLRSPASRKLLGVPLLLKILFANVALIVAALVAGTALTARLVRADPGSQLGWIALFVLACVAVSALVNAVILRLALSPLEDLEKTAERVREGDRDARAPGSPLADGRLARLTNTFNRVLDGLAAYRGRLQDVADRALRAQEAERKRVALELHDETAQTLASLMIRLQVARNTGELEQREIRLDEVRGELAKALEGVRRFARALRPPALDEVGVVAAIREYARSLCETAALHVEVDADPIDSTLSPQAELVLYRIVQEALSNVVRHAGARSVRVRIARRESAVFAEVHDDGRGFAVDDELARTDHGLGVFGMQERAAYVGGSVHVRSRPGAGTTIRVRMPTRGEGGEGGVG